MGKYRLTRRAEADLVSIGEQTLASWGIEQCARYLDALEACCQNLADTPLLGHACPDVGAGFRRMEQGKHVLFYKVESDGVLVVRVLHRRMLPRLHLDGSWEG